jgi:hypothetical protein
MRRKFFAIALLSTLASLLLLILWISSYWWAVAILFDDAPKAEESGPAHDSGSVISLSGSLTYMHNVWSDVHAGSRRDWHFAFTRRSDINAFILGDVENHRAFHFDRRTDEIGSFTFISCPHWALLIPASIIPGVRLLSFAQRRRRRITGACRNCGYDLRATPDRCPECGTEAKTQVSTEDLSHSPKDA